MSTEAVNYSPADTCKNCGFGALKHNSTHFCQVFDVMSKNTDSWIDEVKLENSCPKCGAISLKAVKTTVGYFLACDICPEKPFSKLVKARIKQEVIKAKMEQLDQLTTAWNNYIGDKPDAEKKKLDHMEMTGILWGLVARYRIPLEDELAELKQELEE